MKPFIVIVLLALGLAAGCVTRSASRAQSAQAFRAGQQAGAQNPGAQPKPFVTVLGDVRQHYLPWNDELTLVRALVAAEYRGLSTPRELFLTRRGETVRIDLPRLLNGSNEDPLLEAGDVIELRR